MYHSWNTDQLSSLIRFSNIGEISGVIKRKIQKPPSQMFVVQQPFTFLFFLTNLAVDCSRKLVSSSGRLMLFDQHAATNLLCFLEGILHPHNFAGNLEQGQI
jgi:hypothetical protein